LLAELRYQVGKYPTGIGIEDVGVNAYQTTFAAVFLRTDGKKLLISPVIEVQPVSRGDSCKIRTSLVG
jgi:hypothetical protein